MDFCLSMIWTWNKNNQSWVCWREGEHVICEYMTWNIWYPDFFGGWSLGFAAFAWGALCQTYMFGGSDRRWQGSESLLPWFGHLAASDLEAPTRLLCGDQHAELRKYQTCYVEWMCRRQKLPEELWYLAGAWILSHCQRKRQLKREGTWTQFRWSTPRLLPIQVPSEHRADLICFNDKRLMHRRCDEFQDLWRCLRRAKNLLPPWAMFARAWFWSCIFRTLKYHWVHWFFTDTAWYWYTGWYWDRLALSFHLIMESRATIASFLLVGASNRSEISVRIGDRRCGASLGRKDLQKVGWCWLFDVVCASECVQCVQLLPFCTKLKLPWNYGRSDGYHALDHCLSGHIFCIQFHLYIKL